jgi:hypothetical protein
METVKGSLFPDKTESDRGHYARRASSTVEKPATVNGHMKTITVKRVPPVNPEEYAKATDRLSRVIKVLRESEYAKKEVHYGVFARDGVYSIIVNIEEKHVNECDALLKAMFPDSDPDSNIDISVRSLSFEPQ